MQPLRLFVMLLTIAALTGACGGPAPGATNPPGVTQPPTVTQPPGQPLPPGGGGGGANGSVTYQITGAIAASGELPFIPTGLSTWVPSSNGWSAWFAADTGNAYVSLNTQAAVQIINFSDGTVSIVGTSDPGSSSGCTFTLTKNDPSGLIGSVVCTNALVTSSVATIQRATISAQWNAHP